MYCAANAMQCAEGFVLYRALVPFSNTTGIKTTPVFFLYVHYILYRVMNNIVFLCVSV
jgi:hypothetical protein